MSIAQTLKLRSNQAQQEALVEELVIAQEDIQNEILEALNMTGVILRGCWLI